MIVIQIRHAAPEQSIIIAPIAGMPDGLSPWTRRSRIAVIPYIPIAVTVGIVFRLLKPRMLVAGVIHHKI